MVSTPLKNISQWEGLPHILWMPSFDAPKKGTKIYVFAWICFRGPNICMYVYIYKYWLVVSIPLKNMSQIGSSSQLLGKIKNVPNHQPV